MKLQQKTKSEKIGFEKIEVGTTRYYQILKLLYMEMVSRQEVYVI